MSEQGQMEVLRERVQKRAAALMDGRTLNTERRQTRMLKRRVRSDGMDSDQESQWQTHPPCQLPPSVERGQTLLGLSLA